MTIWNHKDDLQKFMDQDPFFNFSQPVARNRPNMIVYDLSNIWASMFDPKKMVFKMSWPVPNFSQTKC